jgi:short-subunit dehydrogenase
MLSFAGKQSCMSNFKDYFGPWALITGASSGIGAEFARLLAQRGLHLILVARRAERLQSLAQSLQSQHNIEVLVLPLDLTRADVVDAMVEGVGEREIGLLVNNAGMAVEGAFHKQDLASHQRLLALNAATPMMLAHHFVQPMIVRKRGGIIFTASVSAFFAAPFVGHYAATKAYVLYLAESMNAELGRKGIKVQALCPGYTRTEMAEGVPDSILMMQVEPVVKTSLDKLMGGYPSIIPGFINKIMARVLPTILSRRRLTKIAASAIR